MLSLRLKHEAPILSPDRLSWPSRSSYSLLRTALNWLLPSNPANRAMQLSASGSLRRALSPQKPASPLLHAQDASLHLTLLLYNMECGRRT